MSGSGEQEYNAQYAQYYQWWYMQQHHQQMQMQNASVGGYNAAYYSYMNSQMYPQQAVQGSSSGSNSKQSKAKKKQSQPQQQQQQQQVHRCAQPDCTVTGTKKQVQVHMMDRHLIYPPGYLENEERKRAAKPSKPVVPVEGTNIMLDTPEAIEKWVAERKKKFPSAANLAEKERIQEEKRARGELPLDPRFGGRKRRRGDWRSDSNTKSDDKTTAKSAIEHSYEQEDADDNDDDEAPETASSKIPTHQPSKLLSQPRLDKKKLEPRPKQQKRQFEQPNLMAKLFNDEIRQSVSYLSQTIRFLVANEFLENVELEVGEAEKGKMVEEVE